MRIQHNIMAMSAYRNYTNNVSAMKSNLEKLSSGYKINRAGDDAAGLAISEKMRAQITGLETAQKNAKDGISLVQTAEGALTEVHDMLNRMVELATQSANGTYDNETDRAQLQKEVDQLRDEIDRIATSSNFNGIKLLDGSLSEDKTVLAGKASIVLGNASAAGTAFINNATTTGTATLTQTVLHKDAAGAGKTSFEIELDGITLTPTTVADGATVSFTINGALVTVGLATGKNEYSASDIASALQNALSTGYSLNGATYNITVDGSKLKFEMTDASAAAATVAASFTGNYNVQIGVATGEGSMGNNSNIVLATTNIKEGSPNSGTILANTTQTTAWTAGQITDGMVVKVGDEAYIFALSDDTYDKALAVENTAQQDGIKYKVVDVRDLTDKSSATPVLDTNNTVVVSNALTRLTEAAAGNEMFSVGLSVDGTGAQQNVLTFQEKSTYSGDADLSTLAGLASQFAVYTGANMDVTTPTTTVEGKSLTLQIGDTSDSYNQLKVNIGDTHCVSLGIADIDISQQGNAQDAIDKIKAAINKVSDIRGTLGATQNRLDHTINNLSVMTENIQDAESTIRDTDVAEEMMAYTKNNILIQSAQAMLAQANQVPQGVLQLLQ